MALVDIHSGAQNAALIYYKIFFYVDINNRGSSNRETLRPYYLYNLVLMDHQL